MNQHFDPYARNYAALSVKDLLDARNACHVQLSHATNVFATAIGLYRIRATDPDAKTYIPTKEIAEKRGTLGPRTLENTVVQPWSWPCVLVFVEEWIDLKDLSSDREQRIPPFIWLEDGRVVPVCTLEGTLYEGAPKTQTGPLTFANRIIGGGYPVLSEVQGKEHVGSVGCLVTDGDRYYGLTNQHVAGSAGREIYTLIKGERSRVGISADASLRKMEFTRLYPKFAGTKTHSNLDIGLIDVDDIGQWTAQIFGLGVLGQMMDFDCETATLNWIGVPVVAHGATSGRIEGEIKALFYRYRTVNGTDYVSDFLIGGRGKEALATAPGDSGTLWCVDPIVFGAPARASAQKAEAAPVKARALPVRYRPLAVEWGGQKLELPSGDRFTQVALASAVALARQLLDDPVFATS